MKHTMQMSNEELARQYVKHHNWVGKSGGWIYDENDKPIVQGYWHLGQILEDLGIFKEGKGILWANERELARSVDPRTIARRMAINVNVAFNRSRRYHNFAKSARA